MKKPSVRGFLALLAAAAAGLVGACSASAATPRVLAVHFDLEVNPVTQDWLNHQLRRASDDGYTAVAILIDTPGGLSESMRKIVQAELSSPIPVLAYVSPRGARAASAGVWIGQAADLLAMAPETNIGSSTPISGSGGNLGSDLRRKVVNDAAASLRGLAKSHGRNAAWADRAVREASNLTAEEALAQNVVDATAPTLGALLEQIDGRTTKPRGLVLRTAGARVVDVHPSFFTRLLNTLIDPNLIFLLFLAGLAGIGFEIFHPGVVLPGALGAVALLTALFGFSVLPIDWAGLALILLGLALLVVDAHVVSHGTLTLSGLVALVVGGLLLFHDAPSPYTTSAPLVVGVALALGGFWAFALTKAVQVRRRPVTTGVGQLVGVAGVVRPGGLVFVNGELWRARSLESEPLRPGDRVHVEGIEGLELAVRPERAQVGVP